MYFFHPIQQCAQQIYHSALPLSPTSSQLRNFCLQSVIENQLSHLTGFLGAPYTWGLLLRTIDVRPRQLTCIATSVQKIIAACEDVVSIYDAATLVLQQSLRAPDNVIKIQACPDGSILFFGHSHTVTMWDVQTGGLIHTFTIQSVINDIAVSMTGDHIACGSSDGSVAFWNVHTKEKGQCSRDDKPVAVVHWLSPLELVVATQGSVYVCHIAAGRTSNSLPTPGPVWGIVSTVDNRELLVGTSQSVTGKGLELCFLEITLRRYLAGAQKEDLLVHERTHWGWELPTHLEGLMNPIRVGNNIICIAQPNGVRLFDIRSYSWTNNPPLLDAAMAVAISLNRNIVAQTKDSIQIFSLDALTSDQAHNDTCISHIYPLGEKHIVCLLQSNRHLVLLELDTLRELHPGGDTSSLEPFIISGSASAHASFGHGIVAEFGTSFVMQVWKSGSPLPEWTEATGESAPLYGWSPECTRVITIYNSPQWELHVKAVKDGTIIARLPLEHNNLGIGRVYNITFDSETRFYLQICGPGWHIKVPHDIIATPSGDCSHTIIKGEPVHSSEPQATPPYVLDANCEWVIDAMSRKICWISPGNVRRGRGGHLWAGLSLVMVGDDGIVRKLTFKEPDC